MFLQTVPSQFRQPFPLHQARRQTLTLTPRNICGESFGEWPAGGLECDAREKFLTSKRNSGDENFTLCWTVALSSRSRLPGLYPEPRRERAH